MYFFPKLAAFNISWHQKPEKCIDSYVVPKGCLKKPDMANNAMNHNEIYKFYLQMINKCHTIVYMPVYAIER